jgi:hypothetical protein
VRAHVLEALEAVLAYTQLSMRIIAHHVQVTRTREYCRVTLPASHLLYKDIEATSLRQLKTFDILVALLHLLMVQAQLPIRIVAPDKYLSKIKEHWLLLLLLYWFLN